MVTVIDFELWFSYGYCNTVMGHETAFWQSYFPCKYRKILYNLLYLLLDSILIVDERPECFVRSALCSLPDETGQERILKPCCYSCLCFVWTGAMGWTAKHPEAPAKGRLWNLRFPYHVYGRTLVAIVLPLNDWMLDFSFIKT